MNEFNGWHFPKNDLHFKKNVGPYPFTEYQQQTINIAYSYVKDFDTVIDVGANIGLHTVRFAKKFKNVHSFEPVSSNYNCLVENTKIFDNVNLYKNGLGDNNMTTVIKIPIDSTNCGAYSIVDFDYYEGPVKSETIEVLKIDDMNLIPNLIKIDTQGFEEYVLRGSERTIKKCKPVIITECESKSQSNNVIELLQSFGYTFFKKHKKDFICVHV